MKKFSADSNLKGTHARAYPPPNGVPNIYDKQFRDFTRLLIKPNPTRPHKKIVSHSKKDVRFICSRRKNMNNTFSESYSSSALLADAAALSKKGGAFQQSARDNMFVGINTRDNPGVAMAMEPSFVIGYSEDGFPIVRPFGSRNAWWGTPTAPFLAYNYLSPTETRAVDVTKNGQLDRKSVV